MNTTDEKVTLSDSMSIGWGAVKELKVLNDKVLFVLEEGITVEIAGLPPRTIDQMFVVYSRYLRDHHRELQRAG